MGYKFNPFTGNLDLAGFPSNGVVSGSGSSVDNTIVRFDGTTGTVIQSSGVTIDDSNNIVTSGSVTASSFIGSGTSLTGVEKTANKGAANGYASLDSNSLVPITQIPPAALERLAIVADQTARFALTTATVQNGDTVFQQDTSTMYFVKDDTNLGNSSGYQVYSAGTAVNFSGSLTGDITGNQTSTLVSKIQGTTVSGTTGSGNVVFSASPTLTGTITAAAANFSGAITASNFSGSSSGTNTGDVTLAAVGSSPSANGASLSGQVLTLQPADGSNPGLLTAGTQTIGGNKTFTGTISASNLSGSNTGDQTISLTGDVTGSGTGTFATTLATVNGNVGSFGSSTSIPSFTVNAKGLITAASGNAVVAPAGTLSGTTLNATVVSSSLTSVGTISSGVWNGTTIAIANGGTGQTTAASAFSALSPLTTAGDIIYENNSPAPARLPIGSTGQILTVVAGLPAWANTSVTPSSIALTSAHILVGNGSNLAADVAVSGDLTVDNTGNFQIATGVIVNADINAAAAIDASKIADGTVSSTEFQFINSLTSNAQTQLDNRLLKAVGDINETSFTAADNQAAAADVTGLAFANASVRSFRAHLSIVRAATYANYELVGIQRGSDWVMDQSYVGDVTGLVFTITTAGQIQYTSTSTGSTALLKFRAQVTTV